MYETTIDGYGTIWINYWLDDGRIDPVCVWIVPGTIDPLDD
jgi:hypothetical protein